MSEQNKNRLSREDWAKQPQDYDPEIQPELDAAKGTADEWEARALRGRALLRDEAAAESMLQDLDAAIDSSFGSTSSPSIKPKKRGALLTWLSVAAGFLLLALAVWFFRPAKPGQEGLYARYFTPAQNDLSVSLMGDQEADPLTAALRPYNARRYAEAVQSIGNYLQTHTEPRAIRLFYGISLMETGAPADAIRQFRELDHAEVEVYYRQAADWYLALAYLRAGQREAAEAALRTISNPGHLYYQQAVSLLQEL